MFPLAIPFADAFCLLYICFACPNGESTSPDGATLIGISADALGVIAKAFETALPTCLAAETIASPAFATNLEALEMNCRCSKNHG